MFGHLPGLPHINNEGFYDVVLEKRGGNCPPSPPWLRHWMLKTTDQTAAPIIHQPGDQDEFTFIFWFMWTGYYSNNDHLCIVKILVATNSHNMTIDTKFYSALAIWLTAKLATLEEPAVTVQSLPPQFRQQNQESRDQKK